MELDWSEKSPHIRTLYRPWQPGDGIEEATLLAVEKQYGFRLPLQLRQFYQTWGLRRDMTHTDYYLLEPEDLVVRNDAVIFCVEDQATNYWAIPQQALEEADPPVIFAASLPSRFVWEIDLPLVWKPSHTHFSAFLDDLLYCHAFGGGALHGGSIGYCDHQKDNDPWLEQHWQRISVGPMARWLKPDVLSFGGPIRLAPFYIRDGQALIRLSSGYAVAAREARALDEIGQALQATWERRW